MIGILVGIALGVIWVTLGFGAVVLCGALAFVGWFVGGVAEGRISLSEVMQDLQGRRSPAE
jgi:hypothetical protein